MERTLELIIPTTAHAIDWMGKHSRCICDCVACFHRVLQWAKRPSLQLARTDGRTAKRSFEAPNIVSSEGRLSQVSLSHHAGSTVTDVFRASFLSCLYHAYFETFRPYVDGDRLPRKTRGPSPSAGPCFVLIVEQASDFPRILAVYIMKGNGHCAVHLRTL